MDAIDFDAAARDCIASTARLTHELGPRLAGSKACAAAAEKLAEELRGFCSSVRTEPFEVHPSSFYAYLKLLPAAYVLGLVAIYLVGGFYIIPALALVAGIASMLSQFAFYRHYEDFLFPRRTGFNVDGVIEPAGRAERQLILSGHHDSAPVARIFSGPFQRFYALAISLPYVFFFLELGLLSTLAAGGGRPPAWALPVLVAGLPAVVGYFLMVTTRRGSPGAGDNLIASVMVIRLGKEIAAMKHGSLKGTRIRIVSFDAEESGLRGAAAWARAHEEELKELPCSHLNFDSIYNLKDLQVLTSDVNGTVSLSRGMVDELMDCAAEAGIGLRTFGMLFGAGGTDAAESARRGIRAVTLIAMPTEITRSGLVYHTPRDTADHIEVAAVEACLRLTATYLARLEKGFAGEVVPQGGPS